MLSVLISLAALGLTGPALIALSFLASSIWEREAKATTFAALQSAAMLILVLVFFLLLRGGFFETAVGAIILIAGIAVGAVAEFILLRRSGANPRALEGTGGVIVGAVIANQVAGYVANLGYSATANHLSRYDCLLVPLAVDAGMGEMGRLGYLMTREFGPRQRLSAVTTDLPLIPDEPVDIGVENFCRICRKCAVCCPSRSIPEGDPEEVNGSLRWKLNEMTCFGYWGKVGTDCNVCMRVCPWSHARTFPHRMIVWMVARNRLARRLFSTMDDIFYGRRPRPKDPPAWAGFRR